MMSASKWRHLKRERSLMGQVSSDRGQRRTDPCTRSLAVFATEPPWPAARVQVVVALQAVDGVLVEHGIAPAQDLPKRWVVLEEGHQMTVRRVHVPLPPVRTLVGRIVPDQ